jgi:hypothetical protein
VVVWTATPRRQRSATCLFFELQRHMAMRERAMLLGARVSGALLPLVLILSSPGPGWWMLVLPVGILGWSCWSGLRAGSNGHMLTCHLRATVPLALRVFLTVLALTVADASQQLRLLPVRPPGRGWRALISARQILIRSRSMGHARRVRSGRRLSCAPGVPPGCGSGAISCAYCLVRSQKPILQASPVFQEGSHGFRPGCLE